ncbi:rac GTPase-activating protein 1 isoform X1 [Daphnia magna]|uniref:rac GTPase-activating protein 1 isoform X1 n=1 Tax=Daphnia magna TaxID=35525 RepID=UPI001E1BCA11|nr:rac GTPase-activating protein 1 isoform X1 [Daphnia magna]XP_045034833.1 rac GTPase-activating protein 1 isoform X1 [Daphnia magna]
MSAKQVSVLAQYDDLCRGFNYFINSSEKEFLKFAVNQEACRQKWLEAEAELRRLQNQLNEVNKMNGKLELQYHHATVLLKNEIKVRKQVSDEKKSLEKQLHIVREIVSAEKDIRDETREKLAMLSNTGRYSRGNFESPGDRLNTINEMNSTGSLLASFDLTTERTEEELELSVMRSSRAPRSKRPSEGMCYNLDNSKRYKTNRENIMEVSGNERMVATTTVTVNKGGPITATSIIENCPDLGKENDDGHVTPRNQRKRSSSEPGIIPNAPPQCKYLIESSWELPDGKTPVAIRRPSANPSASAQSTHTLGGTAYLRTMASGGRINQRQHTFSQKTIIKPENCLPCGNRIKFGKPALKCIECRGTCHVDCKSRMPMPCVPTVQTPSNKGFVGTVADYAPNISPMIPGIVIHCVNEIERRGLNEVGIYRVNGSEKEIKDMKERLLRGKGQPTLSQIDIHVVTGTLKLFFRSLKEPLITYTLWDSFVRIADLNDEMDIQTTVYSLVPDLPQPNRDTLAYLILHLQRVAEAEICKMPITNLAKIFGPTIIGYSCPDPLPEMALKQLKKQHLTMERLLLIPSDYWTRYVDADTETFTSTPVSSRHPGVATIAKSVKRGPTFFSSPNMIN